MIACGWDQGTVALWDLNNQSEWIHFVAHAGRVGSISFSPDGKHLVTGGDDGLMKTWDVKTGTLIRTIQESSSDSAAGRALPKPSPGEESGSSQMRCLRHHRGGSQIATMASSDNALGTIRLYDANYGQLVNAVSINGAFGGLELSPDGTRVLYLGSRDGQPVIYLHDVPSDETFMAIESGTTDFNGLPIHLRFSSDGQTIGCAVVEHESISLFRWMCE